MNTLKQRIGRIELHLHCIKTKVRQHKPIGFHVAGIKREVVEAIGQLAWGS